MLQMCQKLMLSLKTGRAIRDWFLGLKSHSTPLIIIRLIFNFLPFCWRFLKFFDQRRFHETQWSHLLWFWSVGVWKRLLSDVRHFCGMILFRIVFVLGHYSPDLAKKTFFIIILHNVGVWPFWVVGHFRLTFPIQSNFLVHSAEIGFAPLNVFVKILQGNTSILELKAIVLLYFFFSLKLHHKLHRIFLCLQNERFLCSGHRTVNYGFAAFILGNIVTLRLLDGSFPRADIPLDMW